MLSLVLLLAAVLSFGILHGQDTAQALAATAAATFTEHDVKVITPEQLSHMMDSAKVYVYDCNEPDMFAEAHVPGAVLTVYDDVSEKNLPTDRQAMIVFYCYSPECPAGSNAARTAMKLGHTHVYSMLAGITGWQDAKLKTEP
jgi:rhodanese-related sulfurtransferase